LCISSLQATKTSGAKMVVDLDHEHILSLEEINGWTMIYEHITFN